MAVDSAQQSHPAWQPPSIPVTIGAAFQSWLRPGGSHQGHTPSNDTSGTSSGSSSPIPAPASAEDQQQASVPSHPTLCSPVKLEYSGRWDELAAQAELYLYSTATPYFKGAHIGNVSNPLYDGSTTAFKSMWSQSRQPMSSEDNSTYHAAQRATIATMPHTDGKVASIRWVALDSKPEDQSHTASKGWFSFLGKSSYQPPKQALNVLEIGDPTATAEQEQAEEKVVLLHGYGAGTGFYFQNIAALAARPNSRLYALDWLGMGRSSRPPFSIPSESLKDDVERVTKAESFFIDSLEEWRKKAGIEKMKLVAHSLGAYLSVAYTIKHPERVSRLVLVSPAGVGASPEQLHKTIENESTFRPRNEDYIPESHRGDIDADASSMHTIEREVMEPQEESVPQSTAQVQADVAAVDKGQVNSAAAATADKSKTSEGNRPPRISPRARAFFSYLWEKNFSPFGLLRTSHFLGPWLMSRYTTRRFGALPEEQVKGIHAYCQGVFLGKGSGEYCLAHILLPGAWARIPMLDRIPALQTSLVNSGNSALPVSFVYGDVDWMNCTAGYEVVQKLRSLGNPNGRSFVVPHAGHHTYLDNNKAFDRLLKRILDGQAEKSREGA
ncbi:unnamed protein product [Sympodiomycopsis kandeliae]